MKYGRLLEANSRLSISVEVFLLECSAHLIVHPYCLLRCKLKKPNVNLIVRTLRLILMQNNTCGRFLSLYSDLNHIHIAVNNCIGRTFLHLNRLFTRAFTYTYGGFLQHIQLLTMACSARINNVGASATRPRHLSGILPGRFVGAVLTQRFSLPA